MKTLTGWGLRGRVERLGANLRLHHDYPEVAANFSLILIPLPTVLSPACNLDVAFCTNYVLICFGRENGKILLNTMYYKERGFDGTPFAECRIDMLNLVVKRTSCYAFLVNPPFL